MSAVSRADQGQSRAARSATCASNFLYGRDVSRRCAISMTQAARWLDDVANVRVHGTTHEVPARALRARRARAAAAARRAALSLARAAARARRAARDAAPSAPVPRRRRSSGASLARVQPRSWRGGPHDADRAAPSLPRSAPRAARRSQDARARSKRSMRSSAGVDGGTLAAPAAIEALLGAQITLRNQPPARRRRCARRGSPR